MSLNDITEILYGMKSWSIEGSHRESIIVNCCLHKVFAKRLIKLVKSVSDDWDIAKTTSTHTDDVQVRLSFTLSKPAEI